MHNPHEIKLLARLRVELSHLREHKFRHSFQDPLDPFCKCSWRCSNYSNQGKTLFEKISKPLILRVLLNLIFHKILGLVKDKDTAAGISKASIRIADRNKDIKTTNKGEYWRLLLPGNYTVTVQAEGYLSKQIDINVTRDQVGVINFDMESDPKWKNTANSICVLNLIFVLLIFYLLIYLN